MFARFLTHKTAARNVCLAICGLLLAIPLALSLFLTVFLAVALLLLSQPTEGQGAPRACTHWAAPTGSGSACSETAPCRVDTWTQSTALAQAGRTLCLMDGTYLRSQGGAIDPLDSIAGTADKPITVRALNDGQVLIDAGHTGFAAFLQVGNDYWHLDGLNGTNGKEAVFRSRANHVRFVRVIAYTGTSGEADSLGISMSGPGIDQVCIDCAAWGENMRKIYEFSQSQAPGQDMKGSGCRRCWGEWNDHPEGVSKPNVTYQAGYRSRGQIWENVIGTWRQTGTVGDGEGILRAHYRCDEPDMTARIQLLGSLFYLPNGLKANVGQLATGDCASKVTFRDVAALVGSEHVNAKPFMFRNTQGLTPPVDNVCDRCLGVHAGTPSVNQGGSGWTLKDFREGRTLAEATGGESAFSLLPGLCYRIEGGVLTNTPLWPWPMNDRIKAARKASGAPEVDVTATVEALLGPLPAACKTGATPPPNGGGTCPACPTCPGCPPPGTGALTCTGALKDAGVITLECQPASR